MLLKHDTRDVIRKMDTDTLVDVFMDSIFLMRDVKDIYEICTTTQFSRETKDDLVDTIEDYLHISIDNLTKFNNYKSSTDIKINKYLGKMVDAFYFYKKNLTEAVDCLFNITEKEYQMLIEKSYELISSAAFFCYYEFQLEETINSLNNNEEDVRVDAIVNAFCKREREDLVELVEEIIETAKKFPIHLEVFDKFPDAEQPFIRAIGPAISLIDESLLTEDLVRQVIAGDINAEELLERIGVKEEYNEKEGDSK